jgi:hypothetical protein
MRWSRVALMAVLLSGWCSIAPGQVPITNFDDVAGQWAGHASRHRVTLAIDPGGKFIARSLLGSESGMAKLQDGTLVIPLVEHQGILRLLLQGQELKGAGVLNGKTWDVTLLRTSASGRNRQNASELLAILDKGLSIRWI